jgi:hypothetical protein
MSIYLPVGGSTAASAALFACAYQGVGALAALGLLQENRLLGARSTRYSRMSQVKIMVFTRLGLHKIPLFQENVDTLVLLFLQRYFHHSELRARSVLARFGNIKYIIEPVSSVTLTSRNHSCHKGVPILTISKSSFSLQGSGQQKKFTTDFFIKRMNIAP